MSQFKQDLFALQASKNKTYIEIGASHPRKINNTFLLEQQGWKGFSIELDSKKKSAWDKDNERTNKIYWEDAIAFNYINAVKENGLDSHIGYLSVDIEPPENTFAALKRIIEQGISFDCITFEHDKYQSQINYDPIVTEYLSNFGYKIAVSDVFVKYKYRVPDKKKKETKICYLETWYVHESIPFNPITYEDWVLSL